MNWKPLILSPFFWMKFQWCCNLLFDNNLLILIIFYFSRTTSKKCLENGKVLMMRYGPKSSYLSEIEEWLKPTLEHQSLLSMAAMKDSMDLGMFKIIKRYYIWNFVSKISLIHCTISQSFWCRHKACSCPLLWYFGTLFFDDITIFWDENLLWFWTEKKENLFWTNTKFVYLTFFPKYRNIIPN